METILHIYIIIFILNIRGLIFEVCQKSAKTAKYNSLENFRLYGMHTNTGSILYVYIQPCSLIVLT